MVIRFSRRALMPLMALWALAVVAQGAASGVETPFRFVHVTDTHLTASANIEPLRALVSEVNAMQPRPAFVVDTGDVTESGRPEEFARFQEAASALQSPFYCAPGNHDVRWSPLGKEAFEKAYKRLYQSWDYGGCHFVTLDSAMLLEHWGHFDGAQLKWLESDLKRLHKGTPVFLFFHHGVGRAGDMVDNAEEFLRIIAPYDVRAMFTGHGHADLHWKVNGIDCFMARGLYQGSYHLVEVDDREVRVLRVSKEQPKPQTIATIARMADPRPGVAFGWDDANVSLLARRQFMVELHLEKRAIEDESVKAEYAIDDGKFTRMAPDLRSIPGRRPPAGGRFAARFETKGMSNGAHRLTVQMTAPGGDIFQREETFLVEQLSGQPRREWRYDATDGIQGSPVAGEKLVYAASLDGKLAALDIMGGRRRWQFSARGPISGTPLLAGDTVYVASLDHFLYALDARGGALRWKYDSGAPLFSTPAVQEGIVCLGANGRVVGLDASTGRERWSHPAGSFFQSKAAAANGLFYLGGWDNRVIALDAATGAARWAVTLGRANRGKGAVSFYYSPAIASPAVSGDRVYICSNDGLLHALNAGTGAEVWSAFAPEGGDTFGYSSPLADGGRVYVGGLGPRGDCYALDSASGAVVWRCSTGFENYDSSPVMNGGLLTIGSVSGRFSWIDPANGALRWQYGLEPGHCFSSAAPGVKMAFLTSMNGSLSAISLP